jgi:hypothetical protein
MKFTRGRQFRGSILAGSAILQLLSIRSNDSITKEIIICLFLTYVGRDSPEDLHDVRSLTIDPVKETQTAILRLRFTLNHQSHLLWAQDLLKLRLNKPLGHHTGDNPFSYRL